MKGRPANMSGGRLPDFVIVGAQKSASTFVQTALSAHPEICMPKGETRFFEDPEYGAGDSNALAALFCGRREMLCGIKRPDYLGRPEVPARIHAHIPEAKIIAVLRNPIDRLVSAYYFYIKLGFLPARDINEVIPKLLDGQPIGNVKSGELLAYGCYATHLQRYRQVFPRERIHIMFQEDIQDSPGTALDGLCNFLGICPGRLGPMPSVANSGIYSLARLRFLEHRNRILFEYDVATGKIIQTPTPLWRLAPAAALTLFDRWVLAPVLGNGKPRLESSVRQRLIDYYREEISGTAEFVGRNLEAWK